MTEFKGDKRTKEYKAWKAKYEKESNGVGDTVEKITKATGIKKAVKFLAGEDCGCDQRKKALNIMFPYQKPNCLTEDEFNHLSDWFSQRRVQITTEQQIKLITIYNRVFNDNAEGTSCGSCFVNNVLKKLEKVFYKYR
tara:strand:- start:1644 stop:2057 length:414 start_codon:yes stop_codon:yes gene_type:complete